MFLVDYHDTGLQESFHKSNHATPWTDTYYTVKLLNMKITVKLWTATMSISLSAADFLSRNVFEKSSKGLQIAFD